LDVEKFEYEELLERFNATKGVNEYAEAELNAGSARKEADIDDAKSLLSKLKTKIKTLDLEIVDSKKSTNHKTEEFRQTESYYKLEKSRVGELKRQIKEKNEENKALQKRVKDLEKRNYRAS
jgi:peptidoglycan hydrolase CwlO-like protein